MTAFQLENLIAWFKSDISGSLIDADKEIIENYEQIFKALENYKSILENKQ
ncbi:TPA: hypothetical protein ACX6QF_000001 [Photobacterium damselae]|uniref:hypothetical protein n=1 Tax=Photobacterium damselae TaxID=38293 RepID=UPI000ABF82CE|nr:hypothetical protein [Photobacterium damselae]UKA24105.1 hypothetical protein IHC93_07850 [Photobacterium damselae subsp. damselae]WIH18170.1 hypothetical protein KQY33_07460 [Photobacterium damselae]WIH18175.1 hypothetical protein KQY33_07485 [Photobacterium damselae]